MNILLSSIERDTTIQCRAHICMETVNAYAEAMTDGAKFPEVVLFGTKEKCWIGDGWHRVMAAEQIEARDISAKLNPGGRADALKYALGANALHGQRRSNADKRRCVEIAVKEFGGLSSRAIAELCGVSADMVIANRPQLSESDSSKLMGKDGKHRPATRKPSRPATPEEEEAFYFEKEKKKKQQEEKGQKNKSLIPRDGLQFARMAIMDLEQIKNNDAERTEAFALVKEWINENE